MVNKFRVFSKKTKKMYKEVISLNLNDIEGAWANVLRYDPIEREKIIYSIQPKDCIIIYFTGLQDKNGIDIFEGDIDKKGRVCKYFKNLSAFGFKHPNYSAITFIGQWINSGEIIGNIYEK